MAGYNRRVRRAIVEILWEEGPLTKEEVTSRLRKHQSVNSVPSPNSLGALLSKNPQVIKVGQELVENLTGKRENRTQFDVNRVLIQEKSDILHTLPLNALLKREIGLVSKCPTCGRSRILRENESSCLHCLRQG